MITLYSTNCPKCKVLETKLKIKKIEYTVFTDVDEMVVRGIKSAPQLELDDGSRLEYTEAVQWVNSK